MSLQHSCSWLQQAEALKLKEAESQGKGEDVRKVWRSAETRRDLSTKTDWDQLMKLERVHQKWNHLQKVKIVKQMYSLMSLVHAFLVHLRPMFTPSRIWCWLLELGQELAYSKALQRARGEKAGIAIANSPWKLLKNLKNLKSDEKLQFCTS